MSTKNVRNGEGSVGPTVIDTPTLNVDIEKRYPDGTTIGAAFELTSKPPRVSILFGPSGSGKTTLLRCIAGLEIPTRGCVQYGDEIWSQHGTRHWLRPQKRPIGYLFQDFALFPHLTVESNIGFGLKGLRRNERRGMVQTIISKLGLEGLADRRPDELSGGEQQRVALARVLVREPRILLLDEPFAALDAPTRENVRSYLQHFLSQLEIPALVVTHDWVDALVLGDEMMVLSRGRLLQRGLPQEVLMRPAQREVAAAVGVDTVAEGRVIQRGGGVVRLRVGRGELVAVDPGGRAESFWVCIRGEDVTLEEGPAARSSARNHLSGTVRELTPQGTLTKVVLDVGFALVARVTRQGALDLRLASGTPISAVFKASIVHLIPRSSS